MRARWQPRHRDLAYAAAVLGCVALGTWLFWPTLELGLFADDYVAAAMVDGRFSAPRGALDLFDFANGHASDVAAAQRLGSIPWWAPSDFRIAFMRPLSSALWHVDRALFGDATWAYHAHSIAAWALLVVAASLLYRRLFSGGVAALATLMFAVDDSQHFPVLWLSNRGGIYAVLLGVLGLLAHLRARQDGEPRYAWLSCICFSLALLFGEWALPMFAYVLAFEVLAATDAWRTRAKALLTALGPATAFLIARAVLGYGARGSGAYVDPGAEPLRFALAFFQRAPVLVADMMWNVPASWWDNGSPWRDRVLGWSLVAPATWARLPGWSVIHAVLGVLALVALGALLRAACHGLAAREQRHIRFLVLGALLALTPVIGSFLSTRLTLASYLGVAPVIALVLRRIGRALLSAPRIALPRWAVVYGLGALLAYLHVLAPLQQDVRGQVDGLSMTTPWVLDAELDPARVAQQRVFLLSSREFTTTFYFAYIWGYHGRPLPLSVYPLSAAPTAHDIERVSDNAIELRTLGGVFLRSSAEFMFRDSDRPSLARDHTALPGMRVEVVRASAGAPDALRFVFDKSIDDPSYVFLAATKAGFTRLAMPAVGTTLRLPRASVPNWIKMQKERQRERFAPIPDTLRFAPTPGFVAFRPGR